MSNQDDLIKDLERRAKENEGKTTDVVDDEVEDIEAFLKAQEGDDYVPPPEELKVKPEETKAKAEPVVQTKVQSKPKPQTKAPTAQPAPKAEMVEKPDDPRAVRKKSPKAAKAVEAGDSTFLKLLTLFFKFIVFILPIMIASWVFGAWIGSWVSAGWLVAVVSLLVVLVPGFIFFLFVRKGRIIWWLTGTSVVILGVLVGLFPLITSESVVRHGHWPVTAITQPLKVSSDNAVTRAINILDYKIAGLLKQNPEGVVPTVLGGSAELIPASGTITPQATTETGGQVEPSQPAQGVAPHQTN